MSRIRRLCFSFVYSIPVLRVHNKKNGKNHKDRA